MSNPSKRIYKLPPPPVAAKELAPLDVLERFNPEVKEFSCIKDFQIFLTENKKALDEMTTQKLNKSYKITDSGKRYRITKKLGVICLKYTARPVGGGSGADDDVDSRYDDYVRDVVSEIEDSIKTLERRIEQLENATAKIGHMDQRIEALCTVLVSRGMLGNLPQDQPEEAYSTTDEFHL